jgi:hypothetical protein
MFRMLGIDSAVLRAPPSGCGMEVCDAVQGKFARAPAEVRRSLRWLPLGEPVDLSA